jgi:hypothetical protein
MNFAASSGSTIAPDLNGDGRDELLICYEGEAQLHWGQRSLSRTHDATLTPNFSGSIAGVGFGDLNGDQRPDLMLESSWGHPGIAIYLGGPWIPSSPYVTRAVLESTWILAIGGGVGDINGDGAEEFACYGSADPYGSANKVWIVAGDSTIRLAAAPNGSIAQSYALTILAYPNPFNANSTLRFSLPESGTVRIEFFDITGRILERRAFDAISAGMHEIPINAAAWSSGPYYARLTSHGRASTVTTFVIER